MPNAAAAVIDLDSFRARRAAPRPAPARAPAPAGSPVAYAPFWIVWVPAWPVR
jgi:hypothetical protein